MTAADLDIGHKARITGIDLNHPSSLRIIEFGFTPGQEIETLSKAFFSDPISYSLRGAIIALRKNDARCITIEEA
jgi:ferrous iron transport protein A